MLIECPECKHMVSDKAVACVQCGFPLQTIKIPTTQEKSLEKANNKVVRHKKKHKKLPNGFGTIQKLSGNRRRPYAAYTYTGKFNLNGSPIRGECLGYFETWYSAFDKLREYNGKTEQEKSIYMDVVKAENCTFAEMFELYFADKFEKELKEIEEFGKSKTTSMMYSMRSAFKNSAVLHDKIFWRITKSDFQKVVDDCPRKHATKELLVTLYSQMSEFAFNKGYIKQNNGNVKIYEQDDDEGGVPFYEDELEILWNHCDEEDVQFILLMIYTGCRISEYKNIEVNLEEMYLRGGLKTAAGKNRIIPISDLVADYLYTLDKFNSLSVDNYRKNVFTPTLERLGILTSVENTVHTPHDCRHTFSWLCDKFKVDELSKDLLMGHAHKGSVGRKKYTHRKIEELRIEISKLNNDIK